MARTSLQASLDWADSAACTISSGVVVRRTAWLQASGLPLEVQKTLQDLPFEDAGLFLDQTDSRFHSLKDLEGNYEISGDAHSCYLEKPFQASTPTVAEAIPAPSETRYLLL